MLKDIIRALAPDPLLALYHRAWAVGSARWYGHPSRKLVVIGVTGTKGKSTTSELAAAVLRAAGYRVAVASTIRFAIGDNEEPNLFKMTMPGRGYMQRFLRQALDAGCTHAVIEMTSEGAQQYRHLGVDLDALIFTNLAPEHLESHGGLEAYADAKLELARALALSPKRPRIIVANVDDPYGEQFLNIEADSKAPFSLKDASAYAADDKSVRFVWRETLFTVPLPGLFNLKNCLAALTLGSTLGIAPEVMRKALEHIPPIAGRAERVERGQPFAVVVDYAHTPDSLRALYEAYKGPSTEPGAGRRLICVLGSTGGGRDKWKRKEMGAIADEYCSVAILANEDPYNEDPQTIVTDVAAGFNKHKPEIILDRRAAISKAFEIALDSARGKKDVAVLLTGKGTDPYIMGARGAKEPWSEYAVAQEELRRLGFGD